MALRIAFTSDLHVDFQLEVVGLVARKAAALKPDVLVLAGDLTPDLHLLEKSLRLLVESVGAVAFVPGNHDLWSVAEGQHRGGLDANSKRRYCEILPAIVQRAGAKYLGLQPHVIGDVGLVGVTGWYDGSLRNRKQDTTIRPRHYASGRYEDIVWMDRRRFFWPDAQGSPLPDEALVRWMCEILSGQLNALSPRVKHTVVATHFLTHRCLVRHHGDPKKDFLNAFAGSSALGEIIDQKSNVRRLICGHVRTPVKRQITTREKSYVAEVSPVGYPRERAISLASRVSERLRVVDVA